MVQRSRCGGHNGRRYRFHRIIAARAVAQEPELAQQRALQGKIGLTPIAPANLETIELLDAWENRWFPIADASLARHYPAVL
jgi:hypothetical protein